MQDRWDLVRSDQNTFDVEGYVQLEDPVVLYCILAVMECILSNENAYVSISIYVCPYISIYLFR